MLSILDIVKYLLALLTLAFLIYSAQPSEAVELLHTYDSMKGGYTGTG